MDPNANLREQRDIAARIVEWDDGELDSEQQQQARKADAIRLATLVEAMDDWLSCGGFPPQAWTRDTDTRTKGDDDGQEYGDPRDYRDGKE